MPDNARRTRCHQFGRASDIRRQRRARIPREFKPRLAGEAVGRPRIGGDRLQTPAPDAFLGYDDRGGFYPVGGEDAGGGDRTVGDDQAEVLAVGLLAQSGSYASKAKAFYHSRFKDHIHPGYASEGDLYAARPQRRKRRAIETRCPSAFSIRSKKVEREFAEM